MISKKEFFEYLEHQINEAGNDFRDSDAFRLIELKEELLELVR